jgi:glycerate 2-kinase
VRAIVDAALRASDPHELLHGALSRHPVPADRLLNIVAAGKAARRMTDAFVRAHAGRVRDTVFSEGRHPVPDERSAIAGTRALQLAAASRARDECLVVLPSGGASAMLAAPADGITLDEKAALTTLLLRSGLPIAGINAIRKHVSAIKGGWLAAAAGRSMTFAISDVHAPIEDDPAVIGSGPTVADPATFADALHAADDARLLDLLPASVRSRLEAGVRGDVAETPKPGDPRVQDARFVLAGSRREAMDGACAEALARGYVVERIDPPTLGEASAAAHAFVAHVREVVRGVDRPLCVVASGETTVTLPLSGRVGEGGRNQEFALAAASGLRDLAGCVLASVGTDGIDGPTDAAGAIADATTITRAAALGFDAAVSLAAHDASPFFRALGDLIVTGPTGTNVGDLQIALLDRR